MNECRFVWLFGMHDWMDASSCLSSSFRNTSTSSNIQNLHLLQHTKPPPHPTYKTSTSSNIQNLHLIQHTKPPPHPTYKTSTSSNIQNLHLIQHTKPPPHPTYKPSTSSNIQNLHLIQHTKPPPHPTHKTSDFYPITLPELTIRTNTMSSPICIFDLIPSHSLKKISFFFTQYFLNFLFFP